jgi:hypothetical protein
MARVLRFSLHIQEQALFMSRFIKTLIQSLFIDVPISLCMLSSYQSLVAYFLILNVLPSVVYRKTQVVFSSPFS